MFVSHFKMAYFSSSNKKGMCNAKKNLHVNQEAFSAGSTDNLQCGPGEGGVL